LTAATLNKLKRTIGVKLIGAALVLFGAALFVHTVVSPNVHRVCEYTTRAVVLGLIDNSINDRLDELDGAANYSELISLTYSEEGKVTAVQSNTSLINRIKTDMLTDINNKLMNGTLEEVNLSAGTLSGISVFYGLGGDIRMRLEPKGYADAQFISQFTDAGINQTLHRIIMRTKVTVTAFVPMYSIEIEVDGEFLIAETVIVGDIPESYTHVISDTQDIIEDINDYGNTA